MLLAANGWWLALILALIVWIAIAFWPARVAGRKGHSFFGFFIFSLIFLSRRIDRRVPGFGSNGQSLSVGMSPSHSRARDPFSAS